METFSNRLEESNLKLESSLVNAALSNEDIYDDEDDSEDDETDEGDLNITDLDNFDESQILRGKWTPAEDDLLKSAVQEFGGKNWRRISSKIEGRTDVQCLHRWQKVLRPGLVKGPWTKEV